MKTKLLVAAVLAVSLVAVLEPEPEPEPDGVTIVSATLDASPPIGNGRSYFKWIVLRSDGVKVDKWLRYPTDKYTLAEMEVLVIAMVQADIDAQAEAEDTAPIPRDEIERVTGKTWAQHVALAEVIE